PVCQYMAADPVDTRVVDAFFQALSPVELDVYAQALAKRQQQAERLAKAQAQHLERLRYAAASGERQCRHVAPAHRRRSAKPCSVVSLTRWSAGGHDAIRCTPALSGAAAKPPPVRSRWRSAPSRTCPRRTRWRNRFGCSVRRAPATTRGPDSCPSTAIAHPVSLQSCPARSRASASSWVSCSSARSRTRDGSAGPARGPSPPKAVA